MAPIARWTLLGKNPSFARSSHCLSVDGSGRAILYGGELKPRTPVDSEGSQRGVVSTFDISASTKDTSWERASPSPSRDPDVVPAPRVGAASAIIKDGLYVWGGRGGVDMTPLKGAQTGVWKAFLSVKDVKWERISAVNENEAPEARSFHVVVAHKNILYIHAGCPDVGRVNSLHSFDPASRRWSTLAGAPGPGRGGTVLAPGRIDGADVLLRFAGFAGYELGEDHAIDIYTIHSDKWSTVVPSPDPDYGTPGPRSVHGFVPFTYGLSKGSTPSSLASTVAVLYHGERDPSSLGHAGAGVFWDDVWLLNHDQSSGFAWKKANIHRESKVPEARGWFPSSSFVTPEGRTRIVLQGGLVASNERSDELWVLDITDN